LAGTIIADFIRTDANQLSLNVGNTTFATINASGFFSNTGTQLIAANGKISGASVIASSIPGTAFATAAIPSTKIGTGAVLQVVQATSVSQFSTASTSFVTTGFSASITPTSSTSKILVFASAAVLGNQTSCQPIYTIYRGATNIGDSARGFGQVYSAAGAMDAQGAIYYLDSPATTSSTTYTVYLKVNLGTGYWGHDNGTQVMVLMEIAG
jgi:hypothetical protein